jgi:hypothetical protein
MGSMPYTAAGVAPWQSLPVTATQPRPSADWLAVAILYTPIIGVTFLSKIIIPMGGTEILIAIPMIMGATILGVLTGRLKPHPRRMLMYLGMVAVLTVEQVLTGRPFSPGSLALLASIHLAYGFEIVGGGDSAVHLRRFLNLAFFICLCGIVQYFAQFIIGKTYAFPVEHLLPSAILTKNYNCLIVLKFGSTTYKANGIFMLEPSYFSQLLATGVTLELVGPMRKFRLACFGAGFLVAYSGTGLIMLATTLPVVLIVQKRYSLVVGAVLAAGLLYIGGEFVGLDTYTKRASEFSNEGSSGYQRYVGPYKLIDQYLWSAPSPRRWFFGIGAGMMMKTTPFSLYNVAETGWAKIIIEFGLIGVVAYYGFLYGSVFGSAQPVALRVNLTTMSLASGILDGVAHAMIISLLLWPAAPTPVEPTVDPPAPPETKRFGGPPVRRPTPRLGSGSST